jgi:hypothetical protein
MNKTDARMTLRSVDSDDHMYLWVKLAHLTPLRRRIRVDDRWWVVTGWLLPTEVRR